MSVDISPDDVRFIIEKNAAFHLRTDILPDDVHLQSLCEGKDNNRSMTMDQVLCCCTHDLPTPLGVMTVSDSYTQERAFVLGWNVTGIGLNCLHTTSFDIDIAFVPCAEYPVVECTASITDDGQGTVFSEYCFDIAHPVHRAVLYELLLAEKVHVYLFELSDKMDTCTFALTLLPELRQTFLKELTACVNSLSDYAHTMTGENFVRAAGDAAGAFRSSGIARTAYAYQLYSRRLMINPQPENSFWMRCADGM